MNKMQFLSAKPVVYLVNISEKGYINKKNKWCYCYTSCYTSCYTLPGSSHIDRLAKIHAWVQARSPGAPIIPFSAEFEGNVNSHALT